MNNAKAPKALYVLELRDIGDPAWADVRLRRALKLLGRSFGFACVSIRQSSKLPISTDPQANDAPRATLAAMAAVEALPLEIDDLRDK